MSNFFDELARKRPDLLKNTKGMVESRSTDEVMVSDFEGLLRNMISSEVNRILADRPAPADQKPLSARTQLLFERMHKAVDGVAKHEPSVLPPKPAQDIPGPAVQGAVHPVDDLEISIIDHDSKGRLWHAKMDHAKFGAFVATVVQRDANGRIERASFVPMVN